MSDDLVKQSLLELQDLVRCRCHEAYRGRGLRDPDCECGSADAVKIVADRIEELEAERKKTYEALLKVTRIHDEVEAKLAKIIILAGAMAEAIEDQIDTCDASMDEQIAVKNYRTTLAELNKERSDKKGQDDE